MEVPTVTPPYLIHDDDEKVKDLKEFDETRAGVKGLIDSALSQIPKIFHCPPSTDDEIKGGCGGPQLPVINLLELDINGTTGRKKIADEISSALGTWGFFHIVNHGVPVRAMENLLESIKKFHELPRESKMEFYSRDHTRKVRYYSTGDLYQTKIAQWKDTLACEFEDAAAVDSQSLPSVCRDAILEFVNYMVELRNVLSTLLSEALGLESNKLGSMECLDISRLVGHYYPPCPEPELTQGIVKHSDLYFLTILLQDSIGGLQVYYENQWVDVPPIHGSLIINAGDMLQLVSNDKFISVEHRVKVAAIGPRISAACFLFPSKKNETKPYGPLKELLSENTTVNPPKYRETSYKEYMYSFAAKGLHGEKTLPLFKYVPISHLENGEN